MPGLFFVSSCQMTAFCCPHHQAVANWRAYQDRLAVVTAATERAFSASLDAWLAGAPATVGAKRKRAPRAKLAHQCPWIALVIAYLEWTEHAPVNCGLLLPVLSMDGRETVLKGRPGTVLPRKVWARFPDALLPRKVAALALSWAEVTDIKMEDNRPVCVTFGTRKSGGIVPYARLECKNVSLVCPMSHTATDVLERLKMPAAANRILAENLPDKYDDTRSWGDHQSVGLALTSDVALTHIVSLVFSDGVPESDVDRPSLLSPTCSRGSFLGQVPSDTVIWAGQNISPHLCATDYMGCYDRRLELVRVKRPGKAQFQHVASEARAGVVPRQSARVEARRNGTAPKLPGNSSKRVKL